MLRICYSLSVAAHALHDLCIVGLLGQVRSQGLSASSHDALRCLVPGPVVAKHRHDGQVKADVALHVEAGQAESAVSVYDANLFAGPCQLERQKQRGVLVEAELVRHTDIGQERNDPVFAGNAIGLDEVGTRTQKRSDDGACTYWSELPSP